MQKLFCGTIFCHNIKDFYNEFLRLDVTFERFLGFDPDVGIVIILKRELMSSSKVLRDIKLKTFKTFRLFFWYIPRQFMVSGMEIEFFIP